VARKTHIRSRTTTEPNLSVALHASRFALFPPVPDEVNKALILNENRHKKSPIFLLTQRGSQLYVGSLRNRPQCHPTQ
jgi:hypothetical protein